MLMSFNRLGVIVVVLLFASEAGALNNGLGRLPPMGYNTWNGVQDAVSEDIIRHRAVSMVKSGLRDLGYEYVIVDDGWAIRNATTRRLEPNASAFPSGMKALAQFVHAQGLKFGTYTDRGTKTCAGHPGSYGYERLDAQTFAEWEVDYLKEDNCNAPGGPLNKKTSLEQWSLMRDALNATGRPIFFSVCAGGDTHPFINDLTWYAEPPFGAALGNSWRISADVGAVLGLSWVTARNAMLANANLSRWAGPGGWNDPDMLLTSNPNAWYHITPEQSRTQFSVWALMAAPLIIGGPIANLSAWDFETYSNKEIIDIDQDPLAQQGSALVIDYPLGNHIVWGRHLADGGFAMAFVNCGLLDASITCDAGCWAKTPFATGTVLSVRDLWKHGPATNPTIRVPEPWSIRLGAHGSSQSFKLVANHSSFTPSLLV